MPRPVTEPNVFGQLSGIVSASLLDQNFNALTSITNDSAAGWTNAAVDTGSVNNYVITLVPPASEYTNGFFLSFLPLNANTGPSSINVNGLGNIQILTSSGSALPAQSLQVGTLYTLVCINGAMRIISPSSNVLVGEVQMFGGQATSIPSNWLACNGAAVSRTQYLALFNVIGAIYGAGNGSTTFNVPNYTARYPTHGTPGLVTGANTTVLTIANLPSHNHGINDPGHIHGISDPTHGHTYVSPASTTGGAGTAIFGSNGSTLAATSFVGTGISIVPAATGISTQATGSASAINNIPATVALNFIIRAF